MAIGRLRPFSKRASADSESASWAPSHPLTLNTRHNLAHNTGLAGDAVAARDQYAALLPIRARVLGPEHRDTLTTQANLAHWTRLSDG